MRQTLPILFLAAMAAYAEWPAPKSAMDAYAWVQARRTEAEKLWKNGDARGFEILTDALAYLDQPIVKDLAAGNRYLGARRSNIYLDLAQAYAVKGNKGEALRYLGKFADLIQEPSVVKFLEQEPNFKNLRDDPGWQQVIAKQRRLERLWDSAALSTPYQANLPDPEKLAGLAKLWSEVKYNFGYPEKLVELDWDNLYLQTIPKALATKSTGEYYRALMRLCAMLSDGHTNVYPPRELDDAGKPPFRTALVEGHVMVLDPRSPTLEARGIRAGLEILEVDGAPVIEYARREVEPYQSASTPQDRDNRTFWYGFLRGQSVRPVRLKLRDAEGKEFERELERKGYTDVRRTPVLDWRMLPPGNIAYVALNDFGSNEAPKQWAEIYPRISAASAMILDLRLNGGGDSGIGYAVIRSLVDRPFAGSRQVMRRYNPTDRARGTLMDWMELPAGDIEPSAGPHYKGPVVVLAGPATFSAAEDFLVAWKNSGRGKIIGEPSGGSTGQPLFFRLPGGGTARVCTKRDTFPDGTEWVGKGVEPDILVRPTVADARAGRDTVLERALEYLNAAK